MKKSIVLVGMPGCGKTTIGKKLSKKIGTEFFDMDDCIKSSQNMSINCIFKERGEEYFRNIESDTLDEMLKLSGAVISTGGGIVKKDKNREKLKNSDAYVIFIDRPLENIMGDVDTSTRPLLKNGRDRLNTLYEDRYELYKEVADFRVINDEKIESVINKICDTLENI